MSLCHLQNDLGHGRRLQPMRHIAAQDTGALRNRADIFSVFSLTFARDDQDKAPIFGIRRHDKCNQGGLRLIHRHAVQINPALRLQLSAFEPVIGFFVHVQGWLGGRARDPWKAWRMTVRLLPHLEFGKIVGSLFRRVITWKYVRHRFLRLAGRVQTIRGLRHALPQFQFVRSDFARAH
mgnify:CR=1 FL=1